MRPADPPPPKARNAVKDAMKSPIEAYREEDIVHKYDKDNGDDGNNLPVLPSRLS